MHIFSNSVIISSYVDIMLNIIWWEPAINLTLQLHIQRATLLIFNLKPFSLM